MRDQKVREHQESLDDFYYAKGISRLRGLRLWTQGKAGEEPVEESVEDDD